MQSRAVDKRAQFEVKEGLSKGSLVGRIPVLEGFTYRFNELPKEFSLDPVSGEIKTAMLLDREALTSDRFDFVVLSSQPTYPIEVRIHVLDVNDNAPEFPESSIAVSFSESAEAGTKLLLDTATDKDTAENGVNDDYVIVNGNTDRKFRLSVTANPSGETSYLHLETTAKLDREQVEYYYLNVCAKDRGKPPRLGCLLVNVTVLDVNDNPPVFQQSDYVVAVNESASIGTHVLTVRAIDKDIDDNAKLSYYLPENERQFTIDAETGEILTAEMLDCPQQSCQQTRPGGGCPKSCVITVLARDYGSPRQDARTYVTVNLVDANDHDPEIKFTYFPPTTGFATVDENAAKDSIVAAVGIIDNDEGLNGDTTVEIKAGNELGHFQLAYNTESFHIVRVNGRLDREEIPTYNLTIIATDKGTPPRSTTAYLVIHVNDVNDHEPAFQQSEYSAVLSELSPIGSFVASITATDADTGLNARIYYDFESGNNQNWFVIDQDTGLVTTKAQLDREIQGSVELKVTARDGGPNPKYVSTHLRVTILDENDEAPKFSQNVVQVTLSENTPANSLVATLSAVDNDQGTNGSVAYSLHPNVLRDYPKTFALDALTGQLMTKISMDREKVEEYRVAVIARDQGTPPQSSTATVMLSLEDVNDNPPTFYPTSYFFKLTEDASIGTMVGKVLATDADTKENAQIRYSLESGGEGLFAVDERTGEIFLQGSMKQAHKHLFELIISAKDTGDRSAMKNAFVEIAREESLESLEFGASNGYHYNITENRGDCSERTSYDREVGTVQVTNHQTGSTKVSYAIVYGDPTGSFKINEFTGSISTAGCLDRELTSYYSLQVVARVSLAHAVTSVNITIVDINDNPPRFPTEEREEEVYLKEYAAVGQEVCLARARDRDTGANARISYSLTQNPNKQFRIAENSGIIYLDKPIKSPPGTLLHLEVTAIDSGPQPLSATQQIRVIIEDVNDHTPVFRLTSYETSLPESTPVNERFFALIASDNDLGNNGRVLYSISEGNWENRFGIFPDGQLYVKNVLDHEEQDYYALEVTVKDQGNPPRSSTVPVVVHVIDENDNAPQFSNSSFTFHLRENELSDTFVGKLLASDRDVDRNADLTFSLSSTQQDFAIDPRNGFIKSLHPFDREHLVATTGNNLIVLEASVIDNGMVRLSDKVKVSVYINDVNDNAPQFKRLPYKVQVSEGAAVGTQLLRVYTQDADEGLNGDVFYSLETMTNDEHQEGQFTIDEATGQISLARRLDRETRDNYHLTVVAHDAGLESRLSSSAIVHIEVLDENDNMPRFQDNKPRISVLESAPISEQLLRFQATDDDLGINSELTYGISAGNRRDAFHVDPVSGALYLRRPLDYEEQEIYHLNITCSDAGHPRLSSVITLQVNVVDVNDNPPVFPNTAIVRQILEGIPVHRPVVTVTAEDPDSGDNGVVSYTIASQEPDDQKRRFGINPTTGVIHTLLPIDREEIDTFKLVVVATDNAKPVSARLIAEKQVIVIVTDVNDNAPIFVSMPSAILPIKSTIPYQPGKQIKVAQLQARDLDSSTNGLVTYELLRLGANYSDMFHIHRNTGELTMRLPRSPTIFEKLTKMQVGVRATDEAVQAERRSSETYVSLILPGEGDDTPIWEHAGGKLEGSVYENEPAGASIIRVTARSRRSNEELEYYVTNVTAGAGGPQVDKLFDVEPKSGVLSTTGPLDKEAGVEWYEVEIYAIVSGGGKASTSSTKVRVNVLDKNDVAPSWGSGPWRFEISEDAPANTIVAMLKAHDPDSIGTLKYSIVPPSKSLPFRLDSVTGQLRLGESLDRETKQNYILSVRADDGLQQTDVTLAIAVTDTNDNAPQFQATAYSFDVPENVARGSKIGQVEATDSDAIGPNSQISYALISDWANDVFSLNPNTGVFTLTASLDYEQVQHYILVVQATDSGLPSLSSTVTVYCNVVDLNDNAPIFESGARTLDLAENASVGTIVTTTRAQDLDSGYNGLVAYSIASGDENEDFGIDDNGTLYTRRTLDREAKASYNLLLQAADSPRLAAAKTLTTTIQMTINLLDANDQWPEFVSASEASVPEGASTNAVVMVVKAVDRDEGRNGHVEYTLDGRDAPFSLGSVDGVLRVARPLDRELKANYSLRIQARDRGEAPNTATQTVNVLVLDENDNSPIFDQKQYSASVAENASIGASVLQVSASDLDEGANGRVRYSISAGDDNRDFAISEDTGVIRVAKNLNFERKARYRLQVRAEDCARDLQPQQESRLDNAEVIIAVLDINDNAPVFLDSPYVANVMENMVPPNSGFVMQVKAYDADTPPYNDQVRYFLKEGDTDLFRINASTGEIFLLRPLDRELLAEYVLTLVAMDTGTPPLTGAGLVRITVLDVNDHSPEFQRQEYVARVSENLARGTWLANPRARDSDEGLNARIRYSLLGDKAGRFHVNSSTGEIITLERLDRELKAVYHLTLVAQDSSPTEPRASAVNLMIIVDDQNDNAPRFSSPRYTVYVPDSTTKGDFVFGAKAVDDDVGDNARIVYRLQGKDSHRFTVDPHNGVIRSKETLSSGGHNTYQLQIEASDCGVEPRSVTADLVVHLWERQLFPSFQPATTTRFILKEDVPDGKLVTTLSATTPKTGPASDLVFGMAGGNVGEALRIDSLSGEVVIASGFDYETAPYYEAWVEVRDSGNPSLRSVIQLLVNVTDANDNAPMMDLAVYNASVPEEEYPPQFVTKISAKDADSGQNQEITYHLVNDFEETFIIDETTGEINTNAKLDREEISAYELIVEAHDRGIPSLTGTATVLVTVLDKNDNPPRFIRLYSVNVTENSEIGAFVICITSSDQDAGPNANATYSLTDNPSGKFAIDPYSGNVTVAGHLDREVQDEYLLKVSVVDGAWGAETPLTITIQDQNDNPPEFEEENYHFHFPELQRRMAHVGTVVATDRDKQGPNSVISYSLLQPSDLFNVDPATGDIFSKRTLRYKHTKRPASPENLYFLYVVATDNGKPPLSTKTIVYVSIVDSNNNPPRFEQRSYLWPVPEGYPTSKKLAQVLALDSEDYGVNAEIDYSIASGNGSEYFYVEPKSGWVYAKKSLASFEPGVTFILTVRATDKGVPPQHDEVLAVIVITDENKHSPAFAAVSYQVRVPENEPVNTTILTVNAVDSDDGPNGMVRYEISAGNERHEFSINSVTGVVTILKTLDYDTIQEYRLNITARDLGFESKSSIATLTINVSDINDNSPTFNQSLYEAYLPENSPPQYFVFKVVAKDIDSPKYAIIQYKILGGSGKEHFQIESNTGVIRSKISFDYEEANEYTLDIVAANPDTNPQMVGFTTVLVHITGVNEFYPKFIQPVFHMDVSESADVATSVGVIQATDQDAGIDGKVFYLFVGASNDRGFSIGPETGIISVARRLDRETQNRAILTVMAKNSGGIRGNDTDEAQVIISIQDGNDPPEFLQDYYKASVSEGENIGTKVLTVRAIDKDVRPQNNQFSYSIITGNVGQAFKVDPQSGDVETAKLLDRETISSYELIIGAIDTGSPPQTGSATVRIDLTDVNDNGPTFDANQVVGYVSENEPAGTSIMTLSATDPDLPPNGAPFSYKLIGGKQVDLVSLEKHSGLLKTTRSLDREIAPQLDLLVEVEDSGNPRMRSEHAITVHVLDQNDSPSTPRLVHVTVHAFQSRAPLGKIADVKPNDPDTSGDYNCRIVGTSALTIPMACDLHATKITPGAGYSLSVSGNDGRHPDVVSKVTVEFVTFSNATVENSVTMQISRLKAADFLTKYYRALLELLQGELEIGDTLNIYSVDEKDGHIEVYMAVSSPQGYRTRQELRDFLEQKRVQMETLLESSQLTIGYSPCKTEACDNSGICSDKIVVHETVRTVDSPTLILTSPRVVHEMTCKCRDGFTGDRCEKKQDPCAPNPCHSGGQCRRMGFDFHCSCPANREGKLCELERGDVCASNPCRNGGSCKESPDGSNFFCLCRAGYRGNHCEVLTDSCRPNPCLHGGLCVSEKPGYRCSCLEGRYGRHCERSTFGFDELSFMTFPALDSNTNDITVVFATTKPNALLLYNYGPHSGGRSDFVVLELVEGRVMFSCGGARSAITSLTLKSERSLADGSWRKIIATRNGRVASLSVSDCKEHGDVCDECKPGDGTCYVDDVGPIGTLNFNNNPLMFGGLVNSDPILERPGQVHSDDFVGCVHSVSINGRALNLSNPLSSRGVQPTCARSENGPCSKPTARERDNLCGHGKCYDKWSKPACQCGQINAPNCQGALEAVNLSEGGFIEYKVSEKHRRMQLLEYLYGGTTLWHGGLTSRYPEENVIPLIPTTAPAKSIHLMFRTVKPDGVLVYAATNNHYTSVELRNGHISYASLLSSPVNMSGDEGNSLADGKWHNLTLHSHARGLKMYIDGELAGDELDSAGVHDFLDPYLALLTVGGVRRDLYLAYDGLPRSFEGCLANFTINGEAQPFNGSGSIFPDVIYHGNVHLGCRGPIGIAAASAADPLSVGITLVIVFFIILFVAILASFVIFRLRRQNKEKSATTVVVNKNTNAILTGNSLVSSQQDSLMTRHENTYISDGSDLRNIRPPELVSKKYKEREVSAPQRPDIIEREISKNPPIRDEHPPLPPPTNGQEPDLPEHYDLENASSIAPSDIDIVYHYKGYRDGMRKYKATPPPLNSYANHHKHPNQQHRHAGPFPSRTMAPPSVGQSTPTPKLLQSTPLARLSPSSELSAQQPRILTLHDISGKPLQSALLATTSSSGGVGKDAMNSNSERSLNSPIMSQLSGSTASRKVPQQVPESVNNGVATVPMGLTAEEIERLNSRPRTSSLVSTLDAVSSSSEARGPTHHLHRRHTPPAVKRRNSSTTEESGNDDSFTCSEIDERADDDDDIYSKPEEGTAGEESKHGFDSSFRGSLSTLVASDDEMSTRMGGLYRPTINAEAANTALSWDYLLNWGPNFESLVGVFIDIAELPDGNNRVPNSLRLPNSIAKPSEEYV
ncbi:cadherin-related tumor suppressor [Phymastichus coffea]|uniref:cadherin-related tumor suppressor n=1 Tax=Phymastichus coffea TaxID=108790 RepID=UPI00273AA26C|nr:cadherin-related tumor suppressor [Phymastichus coffea]